MPISEKPSRRTHEYDERRTDVSRRLSGTVAGGGRGIASDGGRTDAGTGAAPVPVRITVTDSVLRAKMPRIGFNICQNPYDDRSTLLQNCLNANPGLEAGVLYRRMFVASDGDARTFEETGAQDEQYQRIVPDSFWAGAEFRVLDGKAAGRKGRVAACTYDGKAKSVYTAEGDGPTFAAGDLIWLSQPEGRGPVDANFRGAYDTIPAGNPARAVEDEHAPFYGGKSCVKLDSKTFKVDIWKTTYIWLPTFKRWGGGRDSDRGGNADRFLQEKTYRITLWAKGTPGTRARFVLWAVLSRANRSTTTSSSAIPGASTN